MMRRDAAALDRDFDLLVIGGGIYGAWIAYDAALRGLTTALIERDDWAAGTSSASSKLIHGGLRYLEYGQVGLVRKALVERGRLLRLGPHRISPLRFLLPIHRDARAGRIALELGLTLYDALAGQLGGALGHRSYGRESLLARCPFLDPRDLVAGFSYSDAGEDDARYTLEIVAGAIAAGAVAVTRCEALSIEQDAAGRACGARVRDLIGGRDQVLRARATVAAAGPWTAGLVACDPRDFPARLTKGVHLVMPPLPIPEAMLLTARSDRRVFFLIPWYGATLLGTTDTDHAEAADAAVVTPRDVDYLLREVEVRCPGLGWRRRDIRGAFAGVRTLRAQPGRSPSSVTREWSLEEPRPGLLAPLGGKLTSARVEAAATVDRVQALLGARVVRTATGERALPWAPAAPFAEWLDATTAAGIALGLDRDVAAACARRYGTTVVDLHALLRNAPVLCGRISAHAPFCLGEAVHAVVFEMALSLDDVLRRRVPLAILARLDRQQVSELAQAIAPHLGWTPEHALEEAWRWHARAMGTARAAGIPTV